MTSAVPSAITPAAKILQSNSPATRPSERSWILVCLGFSVLQAYLFRYTIASDGVSYLDVGDAYFRGDWSAAINAYWSPLYSWCLGLALHVLQPSLRWEFPTIHAVNVLIYIADIFCFRFFLHSILPPQIQEAGEDASASAPLPESSLLALGYSLFLWCSIILIGMGRVTPDLIVASILFLIAGLLVQLRVRQSYGKFVLFGALCGVGYLTKGVLFPLGFVFLAILLFSGRISRRRLFGVVLAAAIFLIVSAPFILALSRAKGRFTFGDTGKLNYIWMVNPRPPILNWQGEPPGSGMPLHTTRKILDDPPVFEFDGPIKGTNPPWDDPSYWDDGMQWHFRVGSQLRVLLLSAFELEKILAPQTGLLAGVLVLVCMGGRSTRRAILANWPLISIAFIAVGLYCLVLMEDRYISGYMALLFMPVFAGVRLPKELKFESVRKYLPATIAISILLAVAAQFIGSAYGSFTVADDPLARDQVQCAAGLQQMGLRPGDKVATLAPWNSHWARLGRFKVVAESSASGDFWELGPDLGSDLGSDKRNRAYDAMSHAGARALVVWNPPMVARRDDRFQQVAHTPYYVYFFPGAH